VQNVLLHRRRGLIIDNPQAWLFRMLHTVCRTARRCNACLPLDRINIQSDPTEKFHREFDATALAARSGQLLSRREFDCVRLRLAGLQYSEIGRELNLKLGTVGTLLNRAVAKLSVASERFRLIGDGSGREHMPRHRANQVLESLPRNGRDRAERQPLRPSE
jgi:DNA-directed RNA polymerase specialized sigma24 family protein